MGVQVYGTFKCSSVLNNLIDRVKLGFLEGLAPTLIPDGTSGTYRLRDPKKETISLFKPIDEEAFAPNNKKGYIGKFGQEGFRKGILSGEGSIREVVAYLLDKKNFFRVPETTFVEISHPSFNKNENGLLLIEENSIPKIRNSIIHNFVIENLISDPLQVTDTENKYKKRHISINQLKKSNLYQLVLSIFR